MNLAAGTAGWLPWARTATVTLYFADGPFLFPVSRQVPATDELPRTALEALLAGPGPASGLTGALPPGVDLLSFRMTDGVARVDLSHAFLERPADTRMAVTAVISTMTAVARRHVGGAQRRRRGARRACRPRTAALLPVGQRAGRVSRVGDRRARGAGGLPVGSSGRGLDRRAVRRSTRGLRSRPDWGALARLHVYAVDADTRSGNPRSRSVSPAGTDRQPSRNFPKSAPSGSISAGRAVWAWGNAATCCGRRSRARVLLNDERLLAW